MHILERLSEALCGAGQCVTCLLASAIVFLVILGYMMRNVLKHSFLCYCHFCNMKPCVLWYIRFLWRAWNVWNSTGYCIQRYATLFGKLGQDPGSESSTRVWLFRFLMCSLYLRWLKAVCKRSFVAFQVCHSQLLCRRPRYHLTVFGRNAAVRAQMRQRLPLLLACKSLQLIQLTGSI